MQVCSSSSLESARGPPGKVLGEVNAKNATTDWNTTHSIRLRRGRGRRLMGDG